MRDWCAHVTLPHGYEWGRWCGEYRAIRRAGTVIAAAGGLPMKAAGSPAAVQAEIMYAIAKGERELQRGTRLDA
jgi:hypothetical protein